MNKEFLGTLGLRGKLKKERIGGTREQKQTTGKAKPGLRFDKVEKRQMYRWKILTWTIRWAGEMFPQKVQQAIFCHTPGRSHMSAGILGSIIPSSPKSIIPDYFPGREPPPGFNAIMKENENNTAKRSWGSVISFVAHLVQYSLC